jgi:hypothetical protein
MEQKKEIIIPENASITELNSLFTKAISDGAKPEILSEIGRKLVEKTSIVQQEQVKRDKLEVERKGKEALLAKIVKEVRYKPTLLKIFGRRSTKEEIEAKVPVDVVFDDIELQDIKGKHTGKSRIYTDEEDLAAYRALKAAGKTNITYPEVEEEMKRLKKNRTGEETEVNKTKMVPAPDDAGAAGDKVAEPGEGTPEEKTPDDPALENETTEEEIPTEE